jgi:tRNA pseudouridine55 synthase
MVMLVGRTYTKRADEFLHGTKEYIAKVRLGESTDTYDSDGEIQKTSPLLPTLSELELALKEFQGQILQIPPMYSAKKVNGKRLYELARKGIEIERAAKSVCVETTLLDYTYPYLELHVRCSGGTYIRSIAHDLGLKLGCFAHLETLERTQVGPFNLKDAQNPLELAESNPLILRQNW